MYKSITFLDNVKATSRQKVLNFVNEWLSDTNFITVYTSGSTGKPKPIKLCKQKVKASALATITFFNLKPNQNILIALSPDYIAGKMMIVRAIEHDLNVIIAPFTSNPLKNKLTHKIHFSAFVPLQIESILSNLVSKKNYGLIEKVIIGGAKISQSLEKKLQILPNLNYATFGMTETISHIAVRNISEKEKFYSALPNVKFYVDKVDCLLIFAPNILDKKISTNDWVDLINENKFIWKGRTDFIINSGGLKFSPEIIEQKIEHVLCNITYYISCLPCETLGEKIILYIEGENSINTNELTKDLSKVLDKYEVPKEIITKPLFERSANGKILRLGYEKN